MTRWRWLLNQLGRQLWLRASLIGLVGVAAAVLAAVVERYIPWQLPGTVEADAVESILNIISSSMLAVTTFSLSVMTSAYSAATSNVTPRATKLLMQDRVTQNVLSTFIGSFLFGIVGIVVLKTGAYGDRGRFILFVVTIGVIVLIVVTLLRWIDHLTRLGRVGETTRRVEEAAEAAIRDRLQLPSLGGSSLAEGDRIVPDGAHVLTPDVIGYVQHIDVAALARHAEKAGAPIKVLINPGAFVFADTPLAWLSRSATVDDDLRTQMRSAFTIDAERSFDQDPRFGLVVLSEIASRALSPAVNDPGTAIDVIGRSARLLAHWADGARGEVEVDYPDVHVAPLAVEDLFEDAFMLVARDGASLVEVQMRLRKALAALSRLGDEAFRAAARKQSALARERAAAALINALDRERLGID